MPQGFRGRMSVSATDKRSGCEWAADTGHAAMGREPGAWTLWILRPQGATNGCPVWEEASLPPSGQHPPEGALRSCEGCPHHSGLREGWAGMCPSQERPAQAAKGPLWLLAVVSRTGTACIIWGRDCLIIFGTSFLPQFEFPDV